MFKEIYKYHWEYIWMLVILIVSGIIFATVVKMHDNQDLRYGFTQEEVYMLAQLISGDENIDGDGEYDIDFKSCDKIDIYEVHKVLCVVMNRQTHYLYPDDVKDILLQKGQFSVFPDNLTAKPSSKSLKLVQDWCERYDNYDPFVQVIPDTHIFFYGDGITNSTSAVWKF